VSFLIGINIWQGLITGISLNEKAVCISCGGESLLYDPDRPTVKCEICQQCQKPSTKSLSGDMTVTYQNLIIENDLIIVNLLQTAGIQRTSITHIEDKLLQEIRVKVQASPEGLVYDLDVLA
jgi:hypothetical protein